MGCFFQRVWPYKLLYNHLLAEPSFVICGAFLLWKAVCGGLFIIRGASFSHCGQCFFCYICATLFLPDWSKATYSMRLQSAHGYHHFEALSVTFHLSIASNMEAILNELGLSILKGKFKAERVETEVVVCISDGNVTSLGVWKINDRSNGSENFAQILWKKTKERATMRGKNYPKRVREERNLFFFNRSALVLVKVKGNGGLLAHSHRDKLWSIQPVCLVGKYSFKTPSCLEKQMLSKVVLCMKKIKLEPNDDDDRVKEKSTSQRFLV